MIDVVMIVGLGEMEHPWFVRVNCLDGILLEGAKETQKSRQSSVDGI
jgi:hypothetical protein